MLRLHSHSSRSYPGRPARFATPLVVAPDMATCRGTGQESAEAIVGARKQARRKEEKPGKTYPAEGPNTEKGRTSMSSHDVLMLRVARKIRDKRVLRLIGKYLRAGVMAQGRLQETRLGVPQGGPLSSLLANIILDDLDKELEKRGHSFVRYADDFIVLVKSRRAGERVMGSLKRFLERTLKLRINQDKSRVVPTNQSAFLGFTFRGTKIRWSEKAFREFSEAE